VTVLPICRFELCACNDAAAHRAASASLTKGPALDHGVSRLSLFVGFVKLGCPLTTKLGYCRYQGIRTIKNSSQNL
jgi:hypothetical protein